MLKAFQIERLFTPWSLYVYLAYYENKVTYIQKYGTDEQKKELQEIISDMENDVDQGKNAIPQSKYYMRLVEL